MRRPEQEPVEILRPSQLCPLRQELVLASAARSLPSPMLQSALVPRVRLPSWLCYFPAWLHIWALDVII